MESSVQTTNKPYLFYVCSASTEYSVKELAMWPRKSRAHGRRMILQGSPARAAGALGGRTIRQPARASADSIELSWTGKAVAIGTPWSGRAMVALR
jgi:hypothetical protein